MDRIQGAAARVHERRKCGPVLFGGVPQMAPATNLVITPQLPDQQLHSYPLSSDDDFHRIAMALTHFQPKLTG
jgi:hypothetical protein